MLQKSITITILTLSLLVCIAAYAGPQSDNYNLVSWVLNSSGEVQQSTDFKSLNSLGEAIVDKFTSQNFQLQAGFIYSVTTFDATAPIGTITINNDSQYTNSAGVTLSVSAQDNEGGSGLDKMQFSNDGINWSEPEDYVTTRSWTLTSGDGTKTVYARFSDKAGNWSNPVSDEIILDTIPPEIIITSPEDGAIVNTPTITVEYTVDSIPKTRDVTITEGPNILTIQETDDAGNTASASITITLDTIPPQIIITSPEDGAVVITQEITLEGTIDGIPFSEVRTLQVGENTITKQATDAAGNTTEASINVFYHPPQAVGPEGGTVISQNGHIAVEIPAGALSTYEEISAIDRDKEDFEDTQSPQDTEVIGILQVLPTGLIFQKPVKLNIQLYEPHIPGTPVKIGLLNEGTDTFEDTGETSYVNIDSYTVTTEINHFSTYAALKSMISSGAPIGGGVQIPTPDLFTGAFTHDIGIEIPKGRKDMHPNLSLQYRSSNPNEWIGAGWQLNLGYIQRSTKKGVPAYNDSVDTFVYVTQSQSTELVHLVDNLYQAKVEGSFVQYYKQADDTWYLLTKDGGKMYFGQTISSKQTTASGTFAWYITEAIDTNGNYIEFNYTKDGGKVYLSQILYTGNYNTAVSPKYEVVFNLEDRTDINSSYISGEECTMSKRLHSIEVYCDLSLVWTYELVYIYSPDTARTLLSSVTQIGSDGTRFPAQTFEYQRK